MSYVLWWGFDGPRLCVVGLRKLSICWILKCIDGKVCSTLEQLLDLCGLYRDGRGPSSKHHLNTCILQVQFALHTFYSHTSWMKRLSSFK